MRRAKSSNIRSAPYSLHFPRVYTTRSLHRKQFRGRLADWILAVAPAAVPDPRLTRSRPIGFIKLRTSAMQTAGGRVFPWPAPFASPLDLRVPCSHPCFSEHRSGADQHRTLADCSLDAWPISRAFLAGLCAGLVTRKPFWVVRRRSLLWTSTIFLSMRQMGVISAADRLCDFYKRFLSRGIPPKSWPCGKANVVSRRPPGPTLASICLPSANNLPVLSLAMSAPPGPIGSFSGGSQFHQARNFGTPTMCLGDGLSGAGRCPAIRASSMKRASKGWRFSS